MSSITLSQLKAKLSTDQYQIRRWHFINQYPHQGLRSHDQELIYDRDQRLVAYIDEINVDHYEFTRPLPDKIRRLLLQYAKQPLSVRHADVLVKLQLPKRDINVIQRMLLNRSNSKTIQPTGLSIDDICTLHHLMRALKVANQQGGVSYDH